MSFVLCSKCRAPLNLKCPGCGHELMTVAPAKGGCDATCRRSECARKYEHRCVQYRKTNRPWHDLSERDRQIAAMFRPPETA